MNTAKQMAMMPITARITLNLFLHPSDTYRRNRQSRLCSNDSEGTSIRGN